MSTLGERLDAAITVADKTNREVAEEAGTSPELISRLTKGHHDNPELQSLIRIATAAKTTVGALLGESFAISAEDEQELLRFRGWINSKLPKIDARLEPNAVILQMEGAAAEEAQSQIADRPAAQPIDNPFDPKVNLVLRAAGESMTGEGILPGDTLYAIAAPDTAAAVVAGKLIACRLGDGIFVKRLVTEHRRFFLRSGNPHYGSIPIDANAKKFEILGVVVGRVGRTY